MPDPDPACNPIVFILISFCFLLFNVILALGDEAFKALADNRIRELEDDGDRKIGRIRRLLEHERLFNDRVRLGILLNSLLAVASLLYGLTTPLSRQMQKNRGRHR